MNHQALLSRSRILSARFRVMLSREGRPDDELLPVYKARVGLRTTGEVGFASFVLRAGEAVRVSVETAGEPIHSVRSRPADQAPPISIASPTRFTFEISGPQKLSLILNGDTLHSLHLFAEAPVDRPEAGASPGLRFFGSGMHLIPGDGYLRLESGETLYLDEDAVLVGKGIVCDGVEDVQILGRGLIDLSPWRPDDAQDKSRPDTRGVDVRFSKRIRIEGVSFLNPNHYTVLAGQSEDIAIRNIKSFSSALWGDGIDCMSTRNLSVHDVFLRTSDDCIAIYGHRWDFFGDTRGIAVTDSQLWADVAHPVLIGTHGLHEGEGDVLENITMKNIDMLLHDEVLEEYQGAIALNAGDNNTLRDMRFEDIRIEEIRSGQIVNLRVFQNPAYNPKPGRRIENICFRNVRHQGPEKKSLIQGFAPERIVENILFEGCIFNGAALTDPADGLIEIGDFTSGLRFVSNSVPVAERPAGEKPAVSDLHSASAP